MEKKQKIILRLLLMAFVVVVGSGDALSQLRYNGAYLLIGPDSIRDASKKLWISDYEGLYMKYYDNHFKVSKLDGRVCLSGANGFVDFVDKDQGEYIYNSIKCYDYHMASGNEFQYGTLQATPSTRDDSNGVSKSSLEMLEQLRPVNFRWKSAARNSEKVEAVDEEALEVGLIAQEVERLFPDLVTTDDAGNKLVNYIGLLPLLFKSLEELNGILDRQNCQIEELQTAIKEKCHEYK